jgi:moderate conductance mechanosensitive channel
LPANWPELALALAAAIVGAYVVADLVARAAESVLRGIIADDQFERRFVDRPRQIVRLVVFVVAAAALAFPLISLAGYPTEFGGNPRAAARWLLESGLRIAIIAVGAYFVVRIGSAAARRFEREMSQGTGLDVVERTKRAQTLGRLLQKTLTVVVMSIAALMILRELRVDITPVLTGAGIVGLAIGFGAQTLVRDVISGFFLILEDQLRVGDVAAINGEGGLVEAVNLRTVVLRDEQGAVHVFPNGEIKTLKNLTKDFSYYVFTVQVGFDDDPEPVIAALKEAGATVMNDPTLRPHILEPIEVYGVDAFEPGLMVIKGRIKTVPQKQWLVGRELRRRIAAVYAERGLNWPLPESITRLRGAEGAEVTVAPVTPPTRRA